MQSLHKYAICGVVMLAIIWSGWAEEPKTPLREDATAGQADARRQMTDGGAQPNAPVMFAPMAGGTNAAGRPSPFSAEISADFMKKVMETSAKIEEAKRQIAERQAQLYATNPEIKSTRTLMIERQKEINRILDADQELAELKMSRDILWSTMPALPKGRNPASMPRMPPNR